MMEAIVILKNSRMIEGSVDAPLAAKDVADFTSSIWASKPEGNLVLELKDGGGTIIIPFSEISTLTFKEKIV